VADCPALSPEISFQRRGTAGCWRQALTQFTHESTDTAIYKEVFKHRNPVTIVSALDVVKEALRLYPPTRRIYRHFGGDRLLGADLEKVHRAEPLAPIDPLQFRLERWSDVEKQWEATEG